MTLVDTMDGAADKGRELTERVRDKHVDLSQQGLQGHRPGHHRWRGSKHTALMLKAGTQVVGGVNARKAGTTVSHTSAAGDEVSLPVYGTVKEAMAETGADVSVVFVPPAFTRTPAWRPSTRASACSWSSPRACRSRTPPRWSYLQGPTNAGGTRMIGPNCPGIITPGEALAGITPATITGTGPVGLVSKSGTLTYQMMFELRDLTLDRHRHRR